jgi:hypothetical protein
MPGAEAYSPYGAYDVSNGYAAASDPYYQQQFARAQGDADSASAAGGGAGGSQGSGGGGGYKGGGGAGPIGRGLHSLTSQLNLSALYGIGGARRGCEARVEGVLGGV